ncbi:hypothetical protein O6H91_Y362600 [Diphasiastrum complanatum]|nr:hypothetical protein O6H91_Y362600 [Diphasiastrum complanatum]
MQEFNLSEMGPILGRSTGGYFYHRSVWSHQMRWLRKLGLLLVTITSLWLISVSAQDAGSYLKAGDESLSRGEYTAAIRHYSSFIEMDPLTSIGYSKRATVYIQQKKLKDALQDLEKSLEVEPMYFQGYLQRARLFRQTCRYEIGGLK